MFLIIFIEEMKLTAAREQFNTLIYSKFNSTENLINDHQQRNEY
jgi:hypothetical protein